MNSKTNKTSALIFAALLIVSVLSSCSRGGSGCPYELSLPSIELPSLVK